ncbi:MAG: bifunctional [glutamine synthetase] adenylyltransferase/[glutamine synthetase]-adenylyl-L-tyrosine phosphorylase, partial [Nitratireductor sp.]
SLSHFLRDASLIHKADLAKLLSNSFEANVETIITQTYESWRTASSLEELQKILRIAKRQVASALGLADLSGSMPTARITELLSQFAEASLSAGCNFLLFQFHQNEKLVLVDEQNPSADSGLIILGMGKLGGHELNYSSDIDIIVFFDLSAKMQLPDDDATSLFVRFTKLLSKLLQERTGDGYVFRTDIRLRPDPGSTPLAISTDAAFNYYEAYGQNWERAAFIKARPSAGDIKAGDAFLKGIEPFIWRKYLDFAAIFDVHSIKRQIHAHKGHSEIAIKGHNVKLGRGGIREIEFFVQTQQLIAGGRDTDLRSIKTIQSLYDLAKMEWISEEARDVMEECYWYLRDVEHRIQMVADEQTHLLPNDDEGLKRIALMMGEKDADTFSEKLIEVMTKVEYHYAALFEASPELTGKGGNLVFTGDNDDPQTLETLTNLGFKQPSQIIATLRGWHYGRLKAAQGASAREMLTELTPALIEAFSEAAQPDKAFFAFEDFLKGLPAGVQLFSILKSNPNLLRLLTTILGSSPRLAQIIVRRPHIFDGLIDPFFSAKIPSKESLAKKLQTDLEQCTVYEDKLEQLRIFANEQKFLISVRLINRTINANQAGRAFSKLAQVLLTSAIDLVRIEFEQIHGKIKGAKFATLGMGRLGSEELTAGSDLDLIFLYTCDEGEEKSDGEKPLYTAQYFMRFVQRLITAMSAPTANGVLYELDFRLRPSGNSGPLATHIDSFVNYQKNEAWVWEQQALVRARVVAGDTDFQVQIEDALKTLLSTKRSKEDVTKEVLKMRRTIDKQLLAINRYDLKTIPGGVIDIEFIAQWGALINGHKVQFNSDKSTISILEQLPSTTISKAQLDELKIAFELYNSVLQILRVNLDDKFDPKEATPELFAMLCEHTGSPDEPHLSSTLKESNEAIRNTFRTLLVP